MVSTVPRYRPPWDINLAAAFYFLFGAVLWELLVNRLAWSMGIFRHLGSEGPLADLATSGQFAMAFVGILAMILVCAGLPRIVGDSRFGPLPYRVALMLVSPFYLPVICVAIFRPVSRELILYAYLAVVGSVILLALLGITQRINSSRRRLMVALTGMELCAAVGYLFYEFGGSDEVVRNAYLLAEVLFVVTPIFGFLILAPRPLGAFLKRPHTLGLFFACLITCVAIFVVVMTPSEAVLQAVAHRALDVRIPVSAGLTVYLLALFMGSLLIGSLVLPSGRWKPSKHSRRIGMGLLGIWAMGTQPIRPYQFALVFMGFVFLFIGLLGTLDTPKYAPEPASPSPD